MGKKLVVFKGLESEQTALILGKQLWKVMHKEETLAVLQLQEDGPQLMESNLTRDQK